MNLNQHGVPLLEDAISEPDQLTLADAHEVVSVLMERFDHESLRGNHMLSPTSVRERNNVKRRLAAS